MKKLLGILVLVLTSCTTIQPVDHTKWNCQKLSEQEYKCLRTYVNGNDVFIVEFIGEAKENKPNGYGKARIGDDDFVSLDGVVRTSNDSDNRLVLIDGWRNIDGTVFYEKDSKVYKVTWPDGSVWEGTQLKKKEGSRHRNLKGTLILEGSQAYRFEGILLDKMDPKLVEGTLYFLSGNAKGNVFSGTWKIDIDEDGFAQNSKKNIVKTGRYSFTSINNKEILYYEGNFYENGFLKKGNVVYRSHTVWDKYVGTHKDDGTFVDGKLYFRNGTVQEYEGGKIKKE